MKKGIALSFVVAFFTAVMGAVALGILDIYLTGHGNRLLQKDFSWGPFSGGIDDVILLTTSFSAAIATFLGYTYQERKH